MLVLKYESNPNLDFHSEDGKLRRASGRYVFDLGYQESYKYFKKLGVDHEPYGSLKLGLWSYKTYYVDQTNHRYVAYSYTFHL